jgi:4-amino-4-deoxy-L-arabinose transferase-like glycosyltransferase
MSDIVDWLNKHTYEIHSLAFGMMVLASVGLYLAAQAGSTSWIWGLIALVGLSNILVIIVK